MAIKDYSTTAGSNTALFPEGMNPGAVNDGMRQVQADIRSFYNTMEWRDFGHVPTYIDGDTFTLIGNQTAIYTVGRRICLSGTLMSNVYATITGSSFSANTTVDYRVDSGSVTNDLNRVTLGLDVANSPFLREKGFGAVSGTANALILTIPNAPAAYVDGMEICGFLTLTNTTAAVNINVNGMGIKSLKINGADPGIGSLPVGAFFRGVYKSSTGLFELQSPISTVPFKLGADIASAATTDLATATGNVINITGTATITSLGTLSAGIEFITTFTGVATLTHNGTSLILPTAGNIVTAAGDIARFVSLGSGNWKCIGYFPVTGYPVSPKVLNYGQAILVQHQTASSGGGGNTNTTSYLERTLNTVVFNNIAGATLSANRISGLPAGDYLAFGFGTAYKVGAHRIRLRNFTDSTTLCLGSSESSAPADAVNSKSFINGDKFTLAASKVINLEGFTQVALTTNGFGVGAGTGEVEIFASILLIKVS